jgi:L-fucose mutarotase
MLKGISPILSPVLLKVLCEMGHGDTIVLADANFPAAQIGRNKAVVRCDGQGIPALLEAVLSLFPLDDYTDRPVARMCSETPCDAEKRVGEAYADILMKADRRGEEAVRCLERFAFYEEARRAYAIVATGERAPYANLILQKGVV